MKVIGISILIGIIGLVSGQRVRERDILNRILDPAKYDNRLRAFGENETEPTTVTVNMYIRNIQEIDDVKMQYKVQLTFRMQWLDKRLEYGGLNSGRSYLSLVGSQVSQLWIPDLFFSNEREGHVHHLLVPNNYIRIFPNGEVLYSTRISLTLSCPMILKRFPIDKQTCSLRMASYGFTTQDIIFKWKPSDPVQVTSDLHLPRFRLEEYTTDYCDSKTNTGIYSCLRLDMLFAREFSYYLIQVYIPCIMFVILAYFSFWIDTKETPTRLGISLSSLLVLSVGTYNLNSTLAPISYTKAIDIWTGVCLTFLFASVLVCVISHALAGRETASSSELKFTEWRSLKEASPSKKVNVVARILYPVVFIIFLISYFSKHASSCNSDALGDNVECQLG